MRKVKIKNRDGGLDEYNAYTIEDFPFFQVPEHTRHAKHKKITYLKAYATFDIETTTIHPDENYPPEGFMYHWQMDVAGVVVYGRSWEEWLELMRELSEWLELNDERRMVCYVFNLAYEFQFIRDFLKEDLGGFEVFAVKSRVPLYVMCGAGFEFRCAYKLTNMRLESACKNELGVEHPKAAGDLDYSKCRVKTTYLDAVEFGYCISDVVSLYELIERRLLNEGDTLDSIPLTSTGYVRRECRNAARTDRHYRDRVFKKQKMSPDVYQLLKEAGRGGNCHANRFMSGRIWPEVDSFDAVSEYPAMLLLKKYPMSKYTYYGAVESRREFDELLGEYACLFRIVLTDVEIKTNVPIPYIPTAKLLSHGSGKYDNGRVLEMSFLSMTITDIDWRIIEKQYNWSSLSISDMYIAKYDYLPQVIRDKVLDYFRRKTELKAKIEKETALEELKNLKYLYGKAKNRVNGIFGMMYTDPVRQSIFINERGEWKESRPDVEEALEKFYKSRNNFLVYAWGIVTTARGREHLQRLVDITGEDTIYCDTDSSKAMITPEILQQIEAENNKIKAECVRLGAFVDVDGKRFYLGIYEHESKKEPYKNFKTLGAKKYAYTDSEGFHITISGVGKETGALEMKDINKFNPGFIFKDAGGKTLYYNDCEKHYITVDGCTMLTASNIGMINSTYELGIKGEYAELLGLNVYKEVK